MFKLCKKKQNMSNIFKVNVKTTEQRLMLLLLTLNIFHASFYCYYYRIRTNIGWAYGTVVSDKFFFVIL